MDIKNLLMCPKCKGELDHKCRCTSGGADIYGNSESSSEGRK